MSLFKQTALIAEAKDLSQIEVESPTGGVHTLGWVEKNAKAKLMDLAKKAEFATSGDDWDSILYSLTEGALPALIKTIVDTRKQAE